VSPWARQYIASISADVIVEQEMGESAEYAYKLDESPYAVLT
jgi:hypothetical protein